MKTRLFIIAALFLGTQAFAQKVTVKNGNEFSTDQLSAGVLVNAQDITLSGTWTNDDLNTLKSALKSDNANQALKNADMSKISFGSNVTNGMTYMFQGCTALETVILPKSSNITIDMKYTFQYCGNLISVMNLENQKVSDFTGTFYNCSSIETISLPSTINTKDMSFSYAFFGCENLTEVFDLANNTQVSDFSSAFQHCTSIEEITLPEGSISRSVNFNYAFNGCVSLSTINNMDMFTTIGSLYATFANCPSLDEVVLSSLPTDITSGSKTFSGSDCIIYLVNEVSYPSDWTNVVMGAPSSSNTARFASQQNELSTTGIDEQSSSSDSIYSYSNTLVINSSVNTQMGVYNLSGRMVRMISVSAGKNTINDLSSGIYIINGKKVAIS